MWGMPEALIRMSLTGSYCILLILPVRFLLSGCGRKYAWCLWAAVFLNLVIPFGIQGSFSLLPRQMEMLPFAGQRMEPSRFFSMPEAPKEDFCLTEQKRCSRNRAW